MGVCNSSLQSRRAIPNVAAALLIFILVLSTYLLQRAMRGLNNAYEGFYEGFLWSSEHQWSLFGLQFSYATLTLVWPIVLGGLCLAFRHFAGSWLLVIMTERRSVLPQRVDHVDSSSLGQQLAIPGGSLLWRTVALLPILTLAFHFLAGLSHLAMLRHDYVLQVTRWTPQLAFLALIVLALSSVFGLWSAVLFWQAMVRLQHELFNSPQSLQPDMHLQDDVRQIMSPDLRPISPGREAPHLVEWDVFISVKKLDETGHRTGDSSIADELCDFMERKGLRVFLSSRSLELLGASAYKEAIDDALDQCQILVAVGTSARNLDSEWVRYEWDSFFNDIISGVKPNGRVFVYLAGVSVSELPRALRQSQAFDHGPSEMQQLYSFITNALPQEGS